MSDCGLNVDAMLTGDMNGLRSVRRYGTYHTIKDESVAEHCFYTALYSLLIARWLMVSGIGEVSIQVLLMSALMHDVEECRSGDIPRPFKYLDGPLRERLEQIAKQEAATVIRDVIPIDEWLLGMWEHAKDSSIGGRVLRLADFMSVVSYLWRERSLGNLAINRLNETTVKYLESFSASEYDFLRPIIDQLEPVVYEVFSK